MKTPEEMADDCLRVPMMSCGKINWKRTDIGATPIDLRERIIAAIREAVAAERAACARLAESLAEPGWLGITAEMYNSCIAKDIARDIARRIRNQDNT